MHKSSFYIVVRALQNMAPVASASVHATSAAVALVKMAGRAGNLQKMAGGHTATLGAYVYQIFQA